MEDWKIARRKPGCAACLRPFDSEEAHVSTIVENGGHFDRRDSCLPCWEKRTEEPFSFWRTAAAKKEHRRLEDINAMQEFFKKLVEKPSDDDTRGKITYLTALLLMRKRRLKSSGSRSHDGRVWLVLEKSWDGEQMEIVDPPIGDPELENLKVEMERLFNVELGSEPAVVAG